MCHHQGMGRDPLPWCWVRGRTVREQCLAPLPARTSNGTPRPPKEKGHRAPSPGCPESLQGCRTTTRVTQPPPTAPTCSRSSSKCVSIPSGPGTEQTRRAFKKVLHLFTRQQWPPSSFCGTGTMLSPARLGTGTLPVPLLPRRTHQADAPDAGIDPRAHRGISGLLAEEEVEFVVVPLAAVGDELGTDEGWVCKGTGQCRQPGGTPSAPLLQSHRRGGMGRPARSLQRSSAGGSTLDGGKPLLAIHQPVPRRC